MALAAVLTGMLASPIGWLVGLVSAVVGLAFYFLPSIVAVVRNTSRFGAIFLVNLLLGWSVIGWVVALVMAVTFARRGPRL